MRIVALLFTSVVLFSPTDCGRVKRQEITFDNSCTTPDSKQGTCVNIKNCPLLYDLLQYNRTVPTIIFIVKSTCYYENKSPIICCPLNEVKVKFPDNNVCGLAFVKRDRVVGGEPAELGSWPWIAVLGYITVKSSTVNWMCGGTLISDSYVVTAAHCITGTGSMIVSIVRLGEHNLDSQVNDGASPMDMRIEKVIPHEHYSTLDRTSDIGLIKLSGKVTYTSMKPPVLFKKKIKD